MKEPNLLAELRLVATLLNRLYADLDGDVPEGAAGRDIAFRKLEQVAGTVSYLRRRLECVIQQSDKR